MPRIRRRHPTRKPYASAFLRGGRGDGPGFVPPGFGRGTVKLTEGRGGYSVNLTPGSGLQPFIADGVRAGIRKSARQLAAIARKEVQAGAPVGRTRMLRRGVRGKSKRTRGGTNLSIQLTATAQSDGAFYGYILNAGWGGHREFVGEAMSRAYRSPEWQRILQANIEQEVNAAAEAEWERREDEMDRPGRRRRPFVPLGIRLAGLVGLAFDFYVRGFN